MVAEYQPGRTALMRGMIKKEKFPHSLIFTGPEGSGKGLIAMKVAAALNCEGVDDLGCGSCGACRKTGRLEHPDLHPVFPLPSGPPEKSMPALIESRREDFFNYGEFSDRAVSIGIGQVRSLIEKLSRHPFEGRRSVVIMFEAHRATVEAQNAFLKLLEEPPRSAAIILVTEYPGALLPTIISRCQEVRFDSLPVTGVGRFLETFYSVEPGEAERISILSGGNLRRGAKFLEERFLAMRKDAVSLLATVLEGKARALPGEAEAAAQGYSRGEIIEMIEEIVIMLRLLMREKAGGSSGEEEGGVLSKAEAAILAGELGKAAIEAASGRDIPADMRKAGRAVESLRRNADAELTLAQLLLDLAGKWY